MKLYAIMLASALAHTPLLAGAPEDYLSFDRISTARNENQTEAEVFANSAAEIVRFDPATNRMFVVNAAINTIDIFQVNPDNLTETPTLIRSVSVGGIPNSVDFNPNTKRNEIAVAVADEDPEKRGRVVFLNKNGDPLGQPVTVGFLPDMLTYDAKGSVVVVANEGEPNDDYSFDPEGSVSIIRLSKNNRTHREVTFSHLTRETIPAGVRITGPEGTTVAQDLEPEYVAIEGSIAYVTMQENNAVAKVDISKGMLLSIMPLGTINHAEIGYAIDASDRDNMVRIANWPVRGLLMPDAIDTYTAPIENGSKKLGVYFVTANEGDSRERDGYSDEARVKDLTLDESAFPLGDVLKEDKNLGRLTVVTTEGLVEGTDDVYQELYSFGSRSFSIFDENGEMVFDSGDMIETYIAENYPDHFNSNHNEGPSFDNRSDNKGPEPEGIVIGKINDRTYAFVGLERFSGVFVCDITNPRDVKFAGFAINRDFTVEYDEDNLDDVAAAGDLGAEGVDFVPADKSPSGLPLLIVASEVSGTVTIYEIVEIE